MGANELIQVKAQCRQVTSHYLQKNSTGLFHLIASLGHNELNKCSLGKWLEFWTSKFQTHLTTCGLEMAHGVIIFRHYLLM